MEDRAIRIMDDDDLIQVEFADVERYHGQHSIAGAALGYQVLRAALAALHPDDLPRRGEVAIVTGHPGPGFRDAFELVTRAVTRQLYDVDVTRPDGRHNPFGAHAYSWSITSGDRAADLVLREGLIPHRFFELWNMVGRGVATPEDWAELVRVKRGVADAVLELPPDALFRTTLAAPR
jgi:hypothetical protein